MIPAAGVVQPSGAKKSWATSGSANVDDFGFVMASRFGSPTGAWMQTSLRVGISSTGHWDPRTWGYPASSRIVLPADARAGRIPPGRLTGDTPCLDDERLVALARERTWRIRTRKNFAKIVAVAARVPAACRFSSSRRRASLYFGRKFLDWGFPKFRNVCACPGGPHVLCRQDSIASKRDSDFLYSQPADRNPRERRRARPRAHQIQASATAPSDRDSSIPTTL
jgi:hypothetical protein